jgi:hypothetical protein
VKLRFAILTQGSGARPQTRAYTLGYNYVTPTVFRERRRIESGLGDFYDEGSGVVASAPALDTVATTSYNMQTLPEPFRHPR